MQQHETQQRLGKGFSNVGFHCVLPNLRPLREKVLSLYDQQIDELQPKEDYKQARRAVIAETLDRYVEAAIDA